MYDYFKTTYFIQSDMQLWASKRAKMPIILIYFRHLHQHVHKSNHYHTRFANVNITKNYQFQLNPINDIQQKLDAKERKSVILFFPYGIPVFISCYHYHHLSRTFIKFKFHEQLFNEGQLFEDVFNRRRIYSVLK